MCFPTPGNYLLNRPYFAEEKNQGGQMFDTAFATHKPTSREAFISGSQEPPERPSSYESHGNVPTTSQR